MGDASKIIEADLRQLSAEAKGYAAVKDAAERGILKLREATAAIRAHDKAALRSPDFLRPFLLATNHQANKKVITVAIGAIQRLITMDAVDPAEPVNILRVLVIQRENVEEEVRLKVLQTLPLLLAPEAYEVTTMFLAQAFETCLLMLEDKSPILQHTAEATIRQLITLVFDRVAALGSAGHIRTPITEGAFKLLEDLCALSSGDKATFLKVSTLNRGLGLELIENILSGHSIVFRLVPLFQDIVRLKLCPMLVRLLRSERSFLVLARLFRATVAFLMQLGDDMAAESEVFLAILVGMVETGAAVIDCEAVDTSRASKSRFGAAGARIVAGAHRILAEKTAAPRVMAEACAAGLASEGAEAGEAVPARVSLPKLILLLETWHVLTLHSDNLRAMYMRHDAVDKDTKVITRLVHALWLLLRHVLSTLPAPDDPDYMDPVEFAELAADGEDHMSSIFMQSDRHSLGRLLPGELDRAAAKFNARPMQNLEIQSDALPSRLSIATLPLLALQCLVNVSDALTMAPVPRSLHHHFAVRSVNSHHASPGRSGSAPTTPTDGSAPSFEGAAAHTKPDETIAKAMAMFAMQAWHPILAALSAMLGACEHEAIVQYVLKTYQTFAATCGKLDLEEARDALLVSMCQFSLPKWRASAGFGSTVMATIRDQGWRVGAQERVTLTHKHILVFKTLFNIAHCFGGLLGTSWVVLLDTFEQFHTLMRRRAAGEGPLQDTVLPTSSAAAGGGDSAAAPPPSTTGKLRRKFLNRKGSTSGSSGRKPPAPPPTKAKDVMPDDEVSILDAALTSLFESSSNLPSRSLEHLVHALSDLALTSLANTATADLVEDRSPTPTLDAVATPATETITPDLDGLGTPPPLARGKTDTASTSSLSSVGSSVTSDTGGETPNPAGGFFGLGTAMSAVSSVAAAAASAVGAGDWSLVDTPPAKGKKEKKGKKDKKSKKSKKDKGAGRDQGKPPPVAAPTLNTAVDAMEEPDGVGGLTSPLVSSAAFNTSASSLKGGKVAARATPPPFAMVKLVETAGHNMHRLALVWNVVAPLLKMLAHNRSPAVREYGLAATLDLATQAMQHAEDDAPPVPATPPRRASLPTYGGPSPFEEEAPPPPLAQAALLAPLADYWRSPFADTREGLLVGLHRCIDAVGPALQAGEDGGWLLITGLLAAVGDAALAEADGGHLHRRPVTPLAPPPSNADTPQTAPSAPVDPYPVPLPLPLSLPDPYLKTARAHAPALVPAAFTCMQLIADDLLTSLPPSALSAFIVCLTVFSKQVADVNTSLAAVGMMWTVADRIGDAAAAGGAAVHDSLWMRLVVQLRYLACGSSSRPRHHPFLWTPPPLGNATDLAQRSGSAPLPDGGSEPPLAAGLDVDTQVHPDVRNSAVQTLYSSLAAHGEQLSERLWEDVMAVELLPLVEAVTAFSRAASLHETLLEGEELGRSRGGGAAVRMVLHHSRNTVAKQWSETRTIALGGLTKVIAAGFPRLRRLPWFRPIWTAALTVLESSVTGRPAAPVPASAPSDVREAVSPPPVHVEPPEVSVAAVHALVDLALLVCVPAGPARAGGKARVAVGMAVVEGALTMVRPAVEEDGPTAADGSESPVRGMSPTTGAGKTPGEGAPPRRQKCGATRSQMWREVTAVLRSACRCLTVLRDDDEQVAVALVDAAVAVLTSTAGDLGDGAGVAVSAGSSKTRSRSFACTKRVASILKLVETLLLWRRRERWTAAQTAAADDGSVSMVSLATPRLASMTAVERAAMRAVDQVVEGLTTQAGQVGGAAAFDDAWQEVLRLLLRLACLEEDACAPEIVLGPGHGASAVALPTSAVTISSTKKVCELLEGRRVPPGALAAVFDGAIQSLATRLEAARRVASAGAALLARHEAGADARALSPATVAATAALAFPMQVWGFTNVARTSGDGVLVTDVHRARRLVKQCGAGTSTLLATLVELVSSRIGGGGGDAGGGGGSDTPSDFAVWDSLLSTLEGMVGFSPPAGAAYLPLAVEDMAPEAIVVTADGRTAEDIVVVPSSPVAKRAADGASTPTIRKPSSHTAANPNIAAFVTTARATALVGGNMGSWLATLGWPPCGGEFVKGEAGEGGGGAGAPPPPDATKQDPDVCLLDAIMTTRQGSVPAVAAQRLLGLLAVGAAALVGRVRAACGTGGSDDDGTGALRKLQFGRRCMGYLMQLAAPRNTTEEPTLITAVARRIAALRCLEMLQFYSRVEVVLSLAPPAQLSIVLVLDTVVALRFLDAALASPHPDHWFPAGGWPQLHAALCACVPTQAGLLRRMLATTLRRFPHTTLTPAPAPGSGGYGDDGFSAVALPY